MFFWDVEPKIGVGWYFPHFPQNGFGENFMDNPYEQMG